MGISGVVVLELDVSVRVEIVIRWCCMSSQPQYFVAFPSLLKLDVDGDIHVGDETTLATSMAIINSIMPQQRLPDFIAMVLSRQERRRLSFGGM